MFGPDESAIPLFSGIYGFRWLLDCALSSTALLPNRSVQRERTDRLPGKCQTVILDVVVTDRSGQPVEGLHKGDFVVAEDGHQQTITSFEEHTGAQAVQAASTSLPPNIFTNVPRVKPADSVTILLLDTLNAQPKEQITVRAQLLKYLKGLKPAIR